MKSRNTGSNRMITEEHLDKLAYVYVRQSSIEQVRNHTESAHRQYKMAEWAMEAGWPKDRVITIDEDQGRSGTSTNSRSGYLELVNAIAQYKVGIVISLEASRLARNNADWAYLVHLCHIAGTLIADESSVYDPSDILDRSMLIIRGNFSEMDVVNSSHRMSQARSSKAGRGELKLMPPAGYDLSEDGRYVMSCDPLVKEAIETAFQKFAELGSVRQVCMWWMEQGRKFPVREIEGKTHGINWVDVNYGMISRLLKHPIYCGAYSYGRYETLTEIDPDDVRKIKKRVVKRKDPQVLLQDRHDAYITPEKYLENQVKITANQMPNDSNAALIVPPREGPALLQGLVRCGKCGRGMTVSYGGDRTGRSSKTMQYRCDTAFKQGKGPICQLSGGKRIDEMVAGEFLEVTRPAAVEAAQQAAEVINKSCEQSNRHWQLQIEKAEYEANLSRRQYDSIDPENKLVVRELAKRWNDRLATLDEVRAKAENALKESFILTEEEIKRAALLGADLRAVWDAETTTNRDKKRLLRCAVKEVQLTTEDERYFIRIIWNGGANTDHYVPRIRLGKAMATSADTVDLVRKLAEECSDSQIAVILNKQGRTSGKGNTFNASRVASLRRMHSIPVCPREVTRDPMAGPFTATEAARELGISTNTVHRLLRTGALPGTQITDFAPWRIMLTEEVRKRLACGDAPEGWVGLGAASRLLGLSKQRVAHLVNTKKLKAVRTKIGNRSCLRIDVSSAELDGCDKQPRLFDQMINDDA